LTKHPDARHPTFSPSLASLRAACRVEECHVLEAVLSFDKGTLCSVFGRAQHLADGLKGSAKAVLLRGLTSVVRALAEGQAPIFLAPFVAGASLAALDKSKGSEFDVRPIAARQIIRRIALQPSACMRHRSTERLGSFVADQGVGAWRLLGRA
jgi:hypothetical protein